MKEEIVDQDSEQLKDETDEEWVEAWKKKVLGKRVMRQSEKLQWKVHTLELFKEILRNPQCSLLYIPINILKNLLAQVAQRATELDDPQLNKLMIRLTLYSIADPNDSDYDSEVVDRILNEGNEEVTVDGN